MIKQLLAYDGVLAVALFRDDGAPVEAYSLQDDDDMLQRLIKFAHDYKRLMQGNADQLSMFTGTSGWTPPGGWSVHGPQFSVCCIANLVAVVNNGQASINEVMQGLRELSNW